MDSEATAVVAATVVVVAATSEPVRSLDAKNNEGWVELRKRVDARP